MPPLQFRTLFGPQVVRADEVRIVDLGSNLAAGLTPGHKRALKTKTDKNEDAVAIFQFPSNVELFLVADAHFGAATSSSAVEWFVPVFESLKGSLESRLFCTHLEIDRRLDAFKLDQPTISDGSSTTLLSVLIHDQHVIWASSGDSLLYLWRDDKLFQINRGHHALFLGDALNAPRHAAAILEGYVSPATARDIGLFDQVLLGLAQLAHARESYKGSETMVAEVISLLERRLGCELLLEPKDVLTPWSRLNIGIAQAVPEFGRFKLAENDLILLASDGLDAAVSGLSQDDIRLILGSGEGDAEVRVREMLDRVLSRDGGMDNCSVVLRIWRP